MGPGGRAWAAWVGIRFRVAYVANLGTLRLGQIAGVDHTQLLHHAPTSVLWAHSRPLTAPFMTSYPIYLACRLRRVLALTYLWVGPEPAAVGLTRALTHTLLAGLGAAIFGVQRPHPWLPGLLDPDPSPLSAPARLVRTADAVIDQLLGGQISCRLRHADLSYLLGPREHLAQLVSMP